MNRGPIIPTRQHSLPILPSFQSDGKISHNLSKHQPANDSALGTEFDQVIKEQIIPSEPVHYEFAFKQAEQAVEYDRSNDLGRALYFYREAILALHSLLFKDKFTLHTLSLEEDSNLQNILMQYRARVDEIEQGDQYFYRPSFNSNSIWSTQILHSGKRRVIALYNEDSSMTAVFNAFNRIKESMISGAFITPRFYMTKEIWDQRINCPLSDVKALYLESLIPHYTELRLESDPQKQSEIASSLNGILLLFKQSLEKHAEDNQDKILTRSPIFNKSHPILNKKSSNSSLNRMTLSPPRGRVGLIDKLKRMTGKVEIVYSVEYISKLKDFLHALMKIGSLRGLEEHENLVSDVVLSFVLSDIEYLVQSHVRECVKN